jgi:hypothetical protein
MAEMKTERRVHESGHDEHGRAWRPSRKGPTAFRRWRWMPERRKDKQQKEATVG